MSHFVRITEWTGIQDWVSVTQNPGTRTCDPTSNSWNLAPITQKQDLRSVNQGLDSTLPAVATFLAQMNVFIWKYSLQADMKIIINSFEQKVCFCIRYKFLFNGFKRLYFSVKSLHLTKGYSYWVLTWL